MTGLSDKIEQFWLTAPIVYFTVFIPLGLFVYHDLVDCRWRRYQWTRRFWLAYWWYYIFAAIVVIFYSTINYMSSERSEGSAALLTIVLGSYVFLKLKRLKMILEAHEKLVNIINVFRGITNAIYPRTDPTSPGKDGEGFKNLILDRTERKREQSIDYGIQLGSDQGNRIEKEKRFEYISNNIFDDDYPGAGGPRVHWHRTPLWGPTGPIKVDPEDGEECITRLALYIRISSRSPRTDLWTCLSATNKLVMLRKVCILDASFH